MSPARLREIARLLGPSLYAAELRAAANVWEAERARGLYPLPQNHGSPDSRLGPCAHLRTTLLPTGTGGSHTVCLDCTEVVSVRTSFTPVFP